jgi:hypothetical protein
MSAVNPNAMQKSIVSVLVVANAGGGSPLLCGMQLYGQGKKAHQPTAKHHHDARTGVDVVRGGGINVQIVLGNGNLGTTQPETGKKDRRDGARDGAARQLARKREGVERRGM